MEGPNFGRIIKQVDYSPNKTYEVRFNDGTTAICRDDELKVYLLPDDVEAAWEALRPVNIALVAAMYINKRPRPNSRWQPRRHINDYWSNLPWIWSQLRPLSDLRGRKLLNGVLANDTFRNHVIANNPTQFWKQALSLYKHRATPAAMAWVDTDGALESRVVVMARTQHVAMQTDASFETVARNSEECLQIMDTGGNIIDLDAYEEGDLWGQLAGDVFYQWLLDRILYRFDDLGFEPEDRPRLRVSIHMTNIQNENITRALLLANEAGPIIYAFALEHPDSQGGEGGQGNTSEIHWGKSILEGGFRRATRAFVDWSA